MRWTPLGTNGFFPSHGRQTMSFLLEQEGRLLLLDAGTGVGRLGERHLAERLRQYESLDIWLSHYHLDHIVGLTFLSAVWRRPVNLWGPKAPLVDATGLEELARLIGRPFFPRDLDAMGDFLTLHDYGGPELEIGPFQLRLRRQAHPGGSVGVRVGDAFAYVTDTEVDEATIDLAAGVDTLLHEVWFLDSETRVEGFAPSGHSATRGVAKIADAAGVRRLIPVHHHPMRDAAGVAAVVEELGAMAGCEVLQVAEGVERTVGRS